MSSEASVSRQFHLLSFEGPDLYASAGGVATRVVGLAEALAGRGFDTHLWFVGDSAGPGVEMRGACCSGARTWCSRTVTTSPSAWSGSRRWPSVGSPAPGRAARSTRAPARTHSFVTRDDPGQFIAQFDSVFARASRVEAMRRCGLRTAREYAWQRVLERHLLPCIGAFDGFAHDALRVA